MADFRKLLYAFALVTLIVGITVPANAQASPTCDVTAVPTVIRSESYTDLMGDIVLSCHGGIPVPAGQGVPAYTFTVSTTAPITSKITDTTFANNQAAFTEALLIIDGPNTHATPTSVTSPPILACGTPVAAPFDPQGTGVNPGVCTITATGTGGGAATGTTYAGNAGHPNVFQGRQLPGSGGLGVQFVGVPFDPPAVNEILTIRITNIRVNAVFSSNGNIQGGAFQVGTVNAQVNITTPSSISVGATVVQTSTIRNGLLYPPVGSSAGPYPQCTVTQSAGGSIAVTEGFPSSFKTRNWSVMQANGIPNVAGNRLLYNVGALGVPGIPVTDLNQNVPGAQYSTESGFMFNQATTFDPIPNAPVGTGTTGQANAASTPFPATLVTGIDQAGTVTNGTRLVFVFSTIPIGSRATVPNSISLTNSQSGSGNPITGAMIAVTGFQADGSGGTLTAVGSTALSETADTKVVYEIAFADPNTIETATIPVTINPVIALGAVTPVNGTPQIGVVAQASAGFAPFYAQGSGTANLDPGISEPLSPIGSLTGLPIARFVPNQSAKSNLFSFTKCACDLLFPWVVADSSFTTSIVVANTSLDPGAAFSFRADQQTGRVRFWYYGTADIDPTGQSKFTLGPLTQQSVGLIPAGSYVAHVVSINHTAATANADAGFAELKGPFAGYVIAQSEFRYCHGVASITSSLAGFGTQTYVGLVMDNGSQINSSGLNAITPLGPRTGNRGEQFDQ